MSKQLSSDKVGRFQRDTRTVSLALAKKKLCKHCNKPLDSCAILQRRRECTKCKNDKNKIKRDLRLKLEAISSRSNMTSSELMDEAVDSMLEFKRNYVITTKRFEEENASLRKRIEDLENTINIIGVKFSEMKSDEVRFPEAVVQGRRRTVPVIPPKCFERVQRNKNKKLSPRSAMRIEKETEMTANTDDTFRRNLFKKYKN